MTTILFVHGTSVRTEGYLKTLKRIEERFRDERFHDFPDLRVEGCLWGDQYGSRRAEKSIFKYAEAGGSEYTEEDAREDKWRLLSADPMAGLRFLALNQKPSEGGRPGEIPPSQQIENAVDGLLTRHRDDLLPKLGEISNVFPAACERLKTNEAFKNLKNVARLPLDPYLDQIAEALVALAIEITAEKEDRFVDLNDNERVRITVAIRNQLGGVSAGLFVDPWKKLGRAILSSLTYAGGLAIYASNAAAVTPIANWRRGQLVEWATPFSGDVLVYQCRGKQIRDLIKARIEEIKGPIVLLAHSLGGVASVDLLLDPACAELSDRVKLLITVGSQAPYFYEIGALHSLPFDEQAGHVDRAFARFPRWLNLHNRRDFLSYIGGSVFPGFVSDREIVSHDPFPQSHSAYFTRKETYAEIHAALGKAFGRA